MPVICKRMPTVDCNEKRIAPQDFFVFRHHLSSALFYIYLSTEKRYNTPMSYQPRERVRRHRFTLNNPFITDDVKALDPDHLTDEQKALLCKEVKHDFSFIRQPQFERLWYNAR